MPTFELYYRSPDGMRYMYASGVDAISPQKAVESRINDPRTQQAPGAEYIAVHGTKHGSTITRFRLEPVTGVRAVEV